MVYSKAGGLLFEVYLISCCAFMWQTCYNRCVSGNEPVTTIIPSSEIHTPSVSTVTMFTNSSVLAFSEDTQATGVSTVTASNSTNYTHVTSVSSVLPDTKSCRKPLSYVSAYTLSILWHVVYWTSQALTWFAVFCCCLSY